MTQPVQNPLMARFQGAPALAQASGAPIQPPAAARTVASRYAGLDTGKDRHPRPQPGVYRLRVVNSGETQMVDQRSGYRGPPYFFIDFEVVEVLNGGDPFRAQDVPTVVGSIAHFDQCMGDGAAAAGGPRIMRAVLALLGGIDVQTFRTEFGDGLIEAAAGFAANDAKGQPFPQNPLAGLEVIAAVGLGNVVSIRDPKTKAKIPDPDGDRYRDYTWTPIPQGQPAVT